jgi:hypothetical protein
MSVAWPKEFEQPTLDEYLEPGPIVSPPVTVQVGKASFEVAFRVLSRQIIQGVQIEARAYLLEQMADNKLDKVDLDSPFGLDLLNNEIELRFLEASCVNPKVLPKLGRAFSIGQLRKHISPQQQTNLNGKWWAWQTSQSVDSLTPDQVEEVIDAVKKKDWGSLIGYGITGLLTCIDFLDSQREILLNGRSLDTGPGEQPLNDSMDGLTPQEVSLLDSYTRLSVSLGRLEKRMDVVDSLINRVAATESMLGVTHD